MGGYNLYQVATYDTSKNDYVMGVAVRSGDDGLVIGLSQIKDVRLRYVANTEPNNATDFCESYVFLDNRTGRVGTKAEWEAVVSHCEYINSALSKIEKDLLQDEFYWTVTKTPANNRWYGVKPVSGGWNDGYMDTIHKLRAIPFTELPEGLEW